MESGLNRQNRSILLLLARRHSTTPTDHCWTPPPQTTDRTDEGEGRDASYLATIHGEALVTTVASTCPLCLMRFNSMSRAIPRPPPDRSPSYFMLLLITFTIYRLPFRTRRVDIVLDLCAPSPRWTKMKNSPKA